MPQYTNEKRARDYRATFGTPEGERVLADLVDRNGIFRPTFEQDPYVTAFNEGRRNVLLDILKYLQVTPEQFRKLADITGDALKR